MRWKLSHGGGFDRFVDADRLRDGKGFGHIRDLEFVAGDAVVLTITAEARGYIRYEPVPTFRLAGGPKDGQVGALRDALRPPETIYFQPVVALNDEGDAIAPVPPRLLAGLTDVYVHHPTVSCPCLHMGRMAWEHTYLWAGDLYRAQRKETGEAQRG